MKIMKKTYILLAAAAILAAAVSCNKEQEIIIEEPTAPANVQVNITVGELMPSTKAIKTGWANGDIIHVYLDDNTTPTSDFDLTYDGTKWTASAISSAVEARLAASGKLDGFWESSNSCMSSAAWEKGSWWMNFPERSNISTTGVMGYLFADFYDVDYTYDGTTLTASISTWRFRSDAHIVVTGLTGDSWTLYSDDIDNMSTISFDNTSPADCYVSYNSAGSPDGLIRGISNADGLAFVGGWASSHISGETITLYLVDNTNSKTYTYSKVLTSGINTGNTTVKAIKIPFSKFVPVGALKGKFTINGSGNKVYFSQGNLQATTTDLGANWTWAFAAHQWDYVGNATANNTINGDGTVSANGTVDLFGWVGVSSTWTGAAQYGISNSTTRNSTDTYGNGDDENLKSDWGNTIGAGWRTLSKDEWHYLFTRASGSTVNGTSDACYTYATINTDGTSVKGMILFPDGITIAADEATTWGNVNGQSNYGTSCTSAKWSALEAKGCVFLPAAGAFRNGSSVSDGEEGCYWSSTGYGTQMAYRVYFAQTSLNDQNAAFRNYGESVRLVHAAD